MWLVKSGTNYKIAKSLKKAEEYVTTILWGEMPESYKLQKITKKFKDEKLWSIQYVFAKGSCLASGYYVDIYRVTKI